MYKVFINESVIYFTNNKEIINKELSFLKFNFFDDSMIDLLYQLLKKSEKLDEIYFFVPDVEKAFTVLKKHFKIIKAAGGWVKNEKEQSLFIYRLNKWDFPKGKIESGEGVESAAIREVEEECGVTNLEIIAQLSDTYHMYEMNDEVILKQTYWFKMQTNFNGKLIPQTEEDITEVVWFTAAQIKEKVLENTYASIASLVC